MRILGIDPGLRITGYGCVCATGHEPALVEGGILRLRVRGVGLPERLAELDAEFTDLLGRLAPDVVAIESLFAHYRHPATAITMGHARGVLLLGAHRAGVRVVEYRPNEIKKSLTGNGHASKEQMQEAIRGQFRLASRPNPPDVADALAVALCAAWRLGRPEPTPVGP